MNPAVPLKVVVALGRVKVPVTVNKELIVSVKAAVRVTLFQLTGSVSRVQDEAIERIELVVVIVPDEWVSVGVPLAAYKIVPDTMTSPAKVTLFETTDPPVHVPPVRTMVVVPVKAPPVVSPPVFQLNNPLIPLALTSVVRPEIVTSWTMVTICVPVIEAVAAVI